MPYDIFDKIPIASKEFELAALTQIQLKFSINFAYEKPLDTWRNPQCKCVLFCFRVKTQSQCFQLCTCIQQSL
jgi:hypothetical protein